MPRAGNAIRIALHGHRRAQIDNKNLPAGLLPLSKFLHGDSRSLQFAQRALPLEVLKRKVRHEESPQHPHRTLSQSIQRVGYLLELVAENKPQQKKAPGVQQRSQAVERQKPTDTHAVHPRQWRHNGTETRNEFSKHNASHAVPHENTLGSQNTGIRLNGDAAKELQDAAASNATEIKPDAVRQ